MKESIDNPHTRDREGNSSGKSDLICFSHLRWDYVYQRPQHLMSHCARERRVLYVEEPILGAGDSRLILRKDPCGVVVAVPYLNRELDKLKGRQVHENLISQLVEEFNVQEFIGWYYTPMAWDYTRHLRPSLVVYDCMDELSAFNGAPPSILTFEKELLENAQLVFTGGRSLYESKRTRHPKVYLFPSSIDARHFHLARHPQPEPKDQALIPAPRLGFFGVIDERMDLELLKALAEERPDWHIVLLGPVAKLDQNRLPRRANIHYLGKKDYRDLPAYLAGWNVALLPFALNQATRYISPTKTPEYLAGGRPVVSTPIRDVVSPYGELGLVSIARDAEGFIEAIECELAEKNDRRPWLERVDSFLEDQSWEYTWREMAQLIEAELVLAAGRDPQGEKGYIGQKAAEESAVAAASKTFSGYLEEAIEISGNAGPNGNGYGAESKKALQKPAVQPRGRRAQEVFDYLIVGAGFAGSVLAERLARGSNRKILLVERRPHIAGNAYDYYDDAGILIHQYGPHIFHTNSQEVFTYLSTFTRWRPYEHRVLASVDGQLLPIPINLDTVNRIYGMNLNSFELDKFFESVAEPKDQLLTSEDVVVSKVGRLLYEKFFRNYTRKQWGMDPSELDATVTSRVPVRNNRDDRYFSDVYQCMPQHGFTRMFDNILDHPNIRILLNSDYREIDSYVNYRQLIFTGPVDEYFDYCFGRLPYRSLQFLRETRDYANHQPVAVVNYPNEHAYTRVTEFKHLTGQVHSKTSLVYEYPCSEGDPYYPIPRPENAALYRQYKALAESLPGVHFAGRLGTYRYYNMDQITAQALALYGRIEGIKGGLEIKAYEPHHFSIEVPCTLLASEEAS